MKLGSLRHRFTGVMLAASMSFGLAVVVVGFLELDVALKSRTLSASTEQLNSLAPLLVERVLVEDDIGLRRMLNGALEASPRWSAVVVQNAHGKVLAAAPRDTAVPSRPAGAEHSRIWISVPLGDPHLGKVYVLVSLVEDDDRALAGAKRLGWAVTVLTVCGVIVAALMGWWLTGPLVAMRATVERVAAGDLSARVDEPEGKDELNLLARAINRSLEAVSEMRAREADQMKNLAEVEKLAALGRLAAGVAHEVANPLAGVAGCVRRLADCEQRPERRQSYVDGALDGLDRATRVLRGMLDFARPAPEAVAATSVADVVEAVLGMATGVAGPSPEAISSGDIDVIWPRERVEQVLLNLLLNAQLAASSRVHVAWFSTAMGVRIEILDDGEGVPVEHADKVFEPFFSTRDPGKGTGLGLAVARAVVQAHQGNIGLERRVGSDGEWTVAWIELPSAIEEKDGPHAA